MSLEHVHTDLPAAQPDVVLALRQALAKADEQVTALAGAGEWEALAYGLHALLPLKRDISDLARRAEDALAASMPTKEVRDLPGLPPFERRKGTDRRAWDWDDLLPRLVRLSVDPDGTGEMPDTPTAIERLVQMVREVIGVTPSKGPRIKPLRELGLDPDEYAQTSPGRVSVQFHEEAS